MARIDQAELAANINLRRSLYEQGLSDSEISRLTGTNRNAITVWRHNNGLPTKPNPKIFPRLTSEQRAARMLLYQLGWSDDQIAGEQHVDKSAIRQWRKTLRLAPNFRPGFKDCRCPRPTVSDLFGRVRAAIGRRLPKDIAEEATSTLMIDLLEGSIPIDQIERTAKRYGNKALEQFANKYGPRSLDEELGEDGDCRMIDMIADERSSSWLEEMGATVW